MRNDTKLDVLWEEVEELKKSGGGGSDLPEVTSADNGKILGVVDGAWNKMDAPAGGVDYSTTEQDTGKKWIDGRPIYQKTYTGVIARGEYEFYNKMDLGAIDAEAVIGIDGGLYDTNGNIIPLFSTLTADNNGYGDYTWEPRIAGGHVEIGLNASTLAIGYNFILTIKYVKPAATETKSTKKRTTKKEENK